jgi:hypothetical protein
MNRFSIALNSPSHPYQTVTYVGVGLLPEIKIALFNIIPIENPRPTLCANQQPPTYVQNSFTSMAKRVGLKQVSNYFINGFNIQSTTRPTPTGVKLNGDVL